MKVIYRKLPSKRIECVATIGVFDGVHLGHRFILEKLKKESRRLNLPSLLITFDVPPQIVLEKKLCDSQKKFPGFLADMEDKTRFIESENLDYTWILKTDASLLKLSGKEFLDYLFSNFIVKHIVIGEDFRFGNKGRANIRYLEKISKKYGFGLSVIKKIHKAKRIISSSLIRQLVRSSHFNKSKDFLGREFYIKGKVVRGMGYGRQLGFPTANIDYDGYVIPREGVYAARIEVGGRKCFCAVNIGIRPTIRKLPIKTMEAHILNFEKNIVGEKIKLWFIKRIRDEKKFSSKTILQQAIKNDVRYIKTHYTNS